jgi:hypothetical protein
MELRLDCSEVVADVVAEVVAEAEAIVTATATATATAATEARENSLPSSQRSSGCLSVHDPVISAVPLLSRRRRGTGHQPAKNASVPCGSGVVQGPQQHSSTASAPPGYHHQTWTWDQHQHQDWDWDWDQVWRQGNCSRSRPRGREAHFCSSQSARAIHESKLDRRGPA